MEDDKMAVDKSTLLNAKPAFPFGAGKLLNTKGIPKEGEEMVHPDSGMFFCGAACNFATAVATSKCPKHNKIGGGYVSPDMKFFVTNQLEILVSSSMKELIALEMIRPERVGDLKTMEVFVVAKEVLELLKASLLSLTVLNDVFGKYCSRSTSSKPKVDGKDLSSDSCSDKPCCRCSKAGSPLHR